MTFVINPLMGADAPDVSRFNAVQGNLKVLLTMVPMVWLTSAFPEEVIWRGFLMTRVAKLGGGSRGAWGMALVLTSVHFGLIHFYQGVAGMVATGIMGLLYGLAFLLLGRNLWVVIVAHAASHALSFTAMYLGLL
jgi:membrane protease YdiL (CAAX protease family)